MPNHDLPSREPLFLPPPTGAYEDVTAAARRRRFRSAGLLGTVSAVAVVAALGSAGALSASSGSSGRDSLTVADASPSADPSAIPSEVPSETPVATPTSTSSPTAVVTPTPAATPTTSTGPDPTASSTPPPAAEPSTPPETCLPFLGRVVSSTGTPLAGIHVILTDPGKPESVTTANGWFTGPKDFGAVVLSPSGNAAQTPSTLNVRALRLGWGGGIGDASDPICADLDAEGKPVRRDVVLAPAAAIEGRLVLGPEVKEVTGVYFNTQETAIEPWLYGLSAYIHDGVYRIVGLPPAVPGPGKSSNLSITYTDAKGEVRFAGVDVECRPGTQTVDVALGTPPPAATPSTTSTATPMAP